MKSGSITLAIVLAVSAIPAAAEQDPPPCQQPPVGQQQALSKEEAAEASAIFARLAAVYRNIRKGPGSTGA